MKVLKKERKKGFTLIELIVVIAILAILALVAVPRLSSFKDSAKKSNDLTNAKNISNAVQLLLANGELSSKTDGVDAKHYQINVGFKIYSADVQPGKSVLDKLSINGTELKTSSTGSDNYFYVVINDKEEVIVCDGNPTVDEATGKVTSKNVIFPK